MVRIRVDVEVGEGRVIKWTIKVEISDTDHRCRARPVYILGDQVIKRSTIRCVESQRIHRHRVGWQECIFKQRPAISAR